MWGRCVDKPRMLRIAGSDQQLEEASEDSSLELSGEHSAAYTLILDF